MKQSHVHIYIHFAKIYKELALKISETTFEKYELVKQRKHRVQNMKGFDPRPELLREKGQNQIPQSLERMK